MKGLSSSEGSPDLFSFLHSLRLMAGVPPVIFVAKSKEDSRSRSRRARLEEVCGHGASSSSSWVPPSPKWGGRYRARSRSADRGALPGLRAMAPGRRERTRATTPNLDSAESRTEAMLALEMDVKAQTTHGSDESRLITMEAWLSKWGATVVPTHNC